MMTHYEEIRYPDDLVGMWNYAHDPGDTSMTSDVFSNKWNALLDMLSGYIYKKNIPGINQNPKEAQDAAMDYLAALLQGPCPSLISTNGYLISSMRKYLARTRNPVQFELNEILHTALLALEKAGKIVRFASSEGKRIRGETLFVLKEIKSPLPGERDDYLENKNIVPFFFGKVRDGDAEKSRILTPLDAQALVLHLLKAFGGWTRTSDLLWAMQNHIPPQMIPVSPSVPSKTKDKELEKSVDTVMDDTADEFIYDSDTRQILMISSETSDRIWKKICKISSKQFCLYYLPKIVYPGKVKVRMEDFGATSTVGDRNKKIALIMADELKNYVSYFQLSGREKVCMKATISKIYQHLQGRCTEKGYIPDLSESEEI